ARAREDGGPRRRHSWPDAPQGQGHAQAAHRVHGTGQAADGDGDSHEAGTVENLESRAATGNATAPG
ncbi:hypothetical protein D7V93_32080, partial [Corallococcus llansteffanensis]